MTTYVNDVMDVIEKIAPLNTACLGDPIGLVIGSGTKEVKKIYFALEIDEYVLEDIISSEADMVVVHHNPMYFPLRNLREDNYYGSICLKLASNGISVYVAHTNWDNAKGGVNDILARIAGITKTEVLNLICDGKSYPMGRIGMLNTPMKLEDYARKLSKALKYPALRYVGDKDKEISIVACLGGAGFDVYKEAIEMGADLLITSDFSHHEAALAKGMGLSLIDGGHFCTENPSMKALMEMVSKEIKDVEYILCEISTNPFESL